MAEVYRSGVFAAKKETTEGTLIAPVAADFIPIREGFAFSGRLETIQSNELVDDIASSKSYTAKETPSGSLPKYFRASGTEGTAPEYDILIESAMGTQTDNGTEYSTSGTSVAGTATVRGHLEMGSNEEDNFLEGQAVLIKSSLGYEIRNVYNVDSAGNQLDLNFNLVNAAAPTGTALGKANHFRPAGTGHPSFSAYHFQSSASGSAFHQAMAGCRTTSMNMLFPANGLAEINFEFEGIQMFFNPITITASTNDAIDLTDDSGTVAATLTAKTYNNPHDLAREVANKCNDVATDTITCTYSDTTGKFTIASDGGVTFSLLWKTGTDGSDNTDQHAGTTLGFDDTANDTGAFTYTSDNAISFAPLVTPSYDTQDSLVVKNSEILIGAFGDNACRPVTNASFSVATPKVDVPSVCAVSGIDSSLTNSRQATFTCQMAVEQFEAGLFDKFINNTTSAVMFNSGEKSGTNWVAGSIVNVYMANASITAVPVVEQDGYVVFDIEAIGFVNTTNKDIHINFL